MTGSTSGIDRRTILISAAALAVGQAASAGAAVPSPAAGMAKPGDFDFLAGEWRISHRRLKTPGSDDWDVFAGEATVWTILGGVGSVEELRIPARDFAGMGLRLLDLDKRIWSDFWVNAKSGVLTPPGMPGRFVDGAGIFEVDDVDGDKPIKVRGVWDRITPSSCRWYQATSDDGGRSWKENWLMDWTRA